MAFPLTVTRLMGFCAFEPSSRGKADFSTSGPNSVGNHKEVVTAYYRQMMSIFSGPLNSIYELIAKEADKLGVSLVPLPESDDLEVTIIQGPDLGDHVGMGPLFPPRAYLHNSSPAAKGEPIIGLFKSRRFVMKIDDTEWDLRIKPSTTACVLESDDRLSKLWWTMEGVPLNKKAQPPSKNEALRFIEITTKLAEVALNPLRDAYTEALHEVTGVQRGDLRLSDKQFLISLADNSDPDFLRLVEAMDVDDVSFSAALSQNAEAHVRKAAELVKAFIGETTGEAVNPELVTFERGDAGLAAIFSKAVFQQRAAPHLHRWAISGLASSVGMIDTQLPTAPAWQRLSAAPELTRSISAARPISATIADQGARQIDSIKSSIFAPA